MLSSGLQVQTGIPSPTHLRPIAAFMHKHTHKYIFEKETKVGVLD